MLHELKCWPKNFTRIKYHDKTAEFRINDRRFKLHDFLYLREWDQKKKRYTGLELVAQIRSVDYAFGIPEGYVMLSIRVIGECG